jgi:hypothetical protein
MPSTYKTLGQANPAANTQTNLYTVPSGSSTVVSSMTICNQGTSNGYYRIAVRPGAEALAKKHYMFYDTFLPPKNTQTLSLGMALSPGTVITVHASSSDLSFMAFGSEVS